MSFDNTNDLRLHRQQVEFLFRTSNSQDRAGNLTVVNSQDFAKGVLRQKVFLSSGECRTET